MFCSSTFTHFIHWTTITWRVIFLFLCIFSVTFCVCFFWWRHWRSKHCTNKNLWVWKFQCVNSLSCFCVAVPSRDWMCILYTGFFLPLPHFIIALLSISCRTSRSSGRPMLNELHFSWTLPWQRGGAVGHLMTRRLGGTHTSCSPCTFTRRDWTRATRQQVSVCLCL